MGQLTCPPVPKVMSAAEAIGRFIKPQQIVQIGDRGIPLGAPSALLNELLRQFHKSDPQFTVVVFGGNSVNLAPLLHCGMVKKVISTFLGDSYPNPSPNPVMQQVYAQGQIELEEWTMLTLTLRLLAGAMGLPFFPTKSIAGSSLTEDNPNFSTVEDPFNRTEGSQVGLVSALTTDVYLTHAWMADKHGNAVILPPYGGNVYGAMAAKDAVIVSAEKIVSTEEVLSYREHIRIPGSYVDAVVELPYGSHPSGHPSFPLQQEGGYIEDREFLLQARKSCRSESLLNDWLREWVFSCDDHQAYLEKLGERRLKSLHICAIEQDSSQCVSLAQPTAEERMIVAAARVIKKKVLTEDYRSVFTGIGAAQLACWLAYYLLKAEGHHISLIVDNGLNGYVPVPGDSYLFSNRNLTTGQMYNDIMHTMGIFVQGPKAKCLAVMGAAQIDEQGNINSSKIPQSKTYIMGPGGGNDAASGEAEVLVVAKQSKYRFCKKVDYVTSPGERVRTVVTQLGVLEKNEHNQFCLTDYVENGASTKAEIIRQVREESQWEFSVLPSLSSISEPTQSEIDTLRKLDPERFYLGKTTN